LSLGKESKILEVDFKLLEEFFTSKTDTMQRHPMQICRYAIDAKAIYKTGPLSNYFFSRFFKNGH
jgi:hypothetical protein